MKALLFRLVKEEDGPTAVEYAVLLALIVVTCLAAVNTLANGTANSFDSSAAQLNTAFGS